MQQIVPNFTRIPGSFVASAQVARCSANYANDLHSWSASFLSCAGTPFGRRHIGHLIPEASVIPQAILISVSFVYLTRVKVV
jgi:hypothetical protein